MTKALCPCAGRVSTAALALRAYVIILARLGHVSIFLYGQPCAIMNHAMTFARRIGYQLSSVGKCYSVSPWSKRMALIVWAPATNLE